MKETSKVHEIQKKSDFVNHVLQKSPAWIIQWGNTFFLAFLLIIVLLTHFIKYPDIIIAEAVITLTNPPISVVVNKSEEIEKIFYKNRSLVEKDSVVLKLLSIADYDDIKNLEKDIFQFEKTSDSLDLLLAFPIGLDYNVGEISKEYNALNSTLKDFKYFIASNVEFKKVYSLKKEIYDIRRLNTSMIKQERFLTSKLELSEANYERNKKLHLKGVISDFDLEKIEASYLEESRLVENFRTNRINNSIRINQIVSEVEDLMASREEELLTWRNKVTEAVSDLTRELEKWKEQFLLIAPISGIVSMDNKIVEKHFIRNGEAAFDIIPQGEKEIIAYAEMPLFNSGEIVQGDEVHLRLDEFPYQEYGIIESSIRSRSLMPKTKKSGQTVSTIELELANPLVTKFGKEIRFTPNMTATALIIKSEKSLLERIFNSISAIFSD